MPMLTAILAAAMIESAEVQQWKQNMRSQNGKSHHDHADT